MVGRCEGPRESTDVKYTIASWPLFRGTGCRAFGLSIWYTHVSHSGDSSHLTSSFSSAATTTAVERRPRFDSPPSVAKQRKARGSRVRKKRTRYRAMVERGGGRRRRGGGGGRGGARGGGPPRGGGGN